jgi:hypothetical protein
MKPCECTVCSLAAGGQATGMSIRDYFAGQAVAGLLACYAKHMNQTYPYSDELADRAYDIADAMLAERAK